MRHLMLGMSEKKKMFKNNLILDNRNPLLEDFRLGLFSIFCQAVPDISNFSALKKDFI